MIGAVVQFALASILLVAAVDGQSVQRSPVPSDDEIRKILIDRIDTQQQSVGIVVGIIGPEGRREPCATQNPTGSSALS
jgi:hypothetical protein